MSKSGMTWKEGAAERRDERATKVDDTPKTLAGAKDTKKWCKGKVGVEHQTKCFPADFRGRIMANAYSLCCTACGRKLDFYFGGLGRSKNPKPDWVLEHERQQKENGR